MRQKATLKNISVIENTFVEDALSYLRDDRTNIEMFRYYSDRLCYLLLSNAIQKDDTVTVKIQTSFEKTKGKKITSLENKLTAIAESNSKHILTDDEAQARAEEIRKDIVVLRVERVDIRIEQYDTEAVKSFTENFLVNLDKLWLQAELSHKQAFQSEIFPNKLKVENGKIRTNDLASTFKLIDELNTENVDLVTLRDLYLNHL